MSRILVDVKDKLRDINYKRKSRSKSLDKINGIDGLKTKGEVDNDTSENEYEYSLSSASSSSEDSDIIEGHT